MGKKEHVNVMLSFFLSVLFCQILVTLDCFDLVLRHPSYLGIHLFQDVIIESKEWEPQA